MRALSSTPAASRACQCSRQSRVVCHSSASEVRVEGTRRALLATLATAGIISAGPASADVELATLYGLASPPTSYGGYGGNVKEAPKYSFLYPASWKQMTVNKVQKGTQGIDCIVQEGRSKQTRAFVIALARAGEDNKSFKLTDTDSTFMSFAGADYDIQDAIASADDIAATKRVVGGQPFYDYTVAGSDSVYRATITVSEGKVFAMFVSSPSKKYKENASTIDKMIESFRTL